MQPCDFCPILLLILIIFTRVPTKEYTVHVRIFLYLLKSYLHLKLANKARCTREKNLYSENHTIIRRTAANICTDTYIYKSSQVNMIHPQR